VGQLVEVVAVSVGEVVPGGPLLGANIDGPTAGRKVAAQAFEIGGWVLGSTAMPDEVEAVLDGKVVARAPVRRPRVDIAEAFPGVGGAGSAGFDLVVDASRAPAETDALVQARFGATAWPIGSLRLRRCWRGGWLAGEQPLVSVVVACEDRGHRLDATVRSVAEQRYGPIELLVVHLQPLTDSTLASSEGLGIRRLTPRGFGAAALRNEGICHSNGQLLLFVEAGHALEPEAIARAVDALARRPEAVALVDGAEGGDVAGAAYRRAAFEELRGFEDAAALRADGHLAQRAAIAYDVLFEPGALVAGRRG
jgi:Glycosyl transferase family 2